MSDNENRTRRRIIEVVSRVFELPADVVAQGVSPDRIEGWDSEKHVELVVALEEQFDCMFEADDIADLTSLEGIEEILTRHGA